MIIGGSINFSLVLLLLRKLRGVAAPLSRYRATAHCAYIYWLGPPVHLP
jgi:hypothetical protein